MHRIWDYIKALFLRSWNLFVKGEEEWRVVASETEVNPFTSYVVPNVVLCCLLSICGGLLQRLNYTALIVNPIVIAIVLFVTYFVALYASRIAVKRIYNVDIPSRGNVCLIAYCMSTIFFIRMFLALAPAFFFIRALVLLVPYTMMFAMRALMPIENATLDEETRRNSYLFVVSSVIILMPTLVEYVLEHVILRNL